MVDLSIGKDNDCHLVGNLLMIALWEEVKHMPRTLKGKKYVSNYLMFSRQVARRNRRCYVCQDLIKTGTVSTRLNKGDVRINFCDECLKINRLTETDGYEVIRKED